MRIIVPLIFFVRHLELKILELLRYRNSKYEIK